MDIFNKKARQLMEFKEALDKRYAEEFQAYFDKWTAEVIEDSGLTKGVDFLSRDFLAKQVAAVKANTPAKAAQHNVVMPGVYRTRDGFRVEVKSQAPGTELLIIEMLGADYRPNNLQSMSPILFKRMFEREGLVEIKGNPLLLESKVEHNQEWQSCFSWSEISFQIQHVNERLRALNKNVDLRHSDDAKADVMELLFLIYILAGRLGHSAENDFVEVHRSVFAMVDRTEEEAKQTQASYRERGMHTEYREIKIYDLHNRENPPITYYPTVLTVKVGMTGGRILPAGSFLPSACMKRD